jgi:hypothetical protein
MAMEQYEVDVLGLTSKKICENLGQHEKNSRHDEKFSHFCDYDF